MCGGNFVAISAIFHTQHFKHSLLYITNTPRMFSINKQTSYQQITTRATMRLLEQREVRLLACAYNNWVFINFLFFFCTKNIKGARKQLQKLLKVSLVVINNVKYSRYALEAYYFFKCLRYPCSAFTVIR